MGYSSIIRKGCKGDCGRMPEIGGQGYCFTCRPDLKELIVAKNKKRNALKLASPKLIAIGYEDDGNREMVLKHKGKSELLKEADRLFSLFIRNRDADKDGYISCVCCGGIYNIEQLDGSGNKVVQCLHFMKREVYALRFQEDYAGAGCTYCNKNMFDNPKGKAYHQFKDKLISDFGLIEVQRIETLNREINKLTESDLKNIIEHYSTVNT